MLSKLLSANASGYSLRIALTTARVYGADDIVARDTIGNINGFLAQEYENAKVENGKVK